MISGPPGTGKSQTIANLISTLVAHGRSVLFVAEKRAAIAAVLDRLSSVGLADLVLDLHDGSGSRRAFAEKISARIRSVSRIPEPDQAALHERLTASRQHLNAHDAAMHGKREPWGISTFEAQSALLGLLAEHGGAADTRIRIRGRDLACTDATVMRRVREEIVEFASLGGLTLTEDESMWANAHIVSTEQAESAMHAATRLERDTAPQARRVLDKVLEETGLKVPLTIAAWTETLELLDRVAALLVCFDPAVFGERLPDMVAATAKSDWRKQHADAPGTAANWSTRRRTRKAARALWTSTVRPTRKRMHEALVEAEEINKAWAGQTVGDSVPKLPAALQDARGRYNQLIRELAALGAYLASTDLSTLPAGALPTTLTRLTTDERTLRKLPRLNELAAAFGRYGLDELIADLRERRLDPTSAAAAFQICWYQSILERIGFDDPAIAAFDSGLQDTYSRGFQETDAQHINQTAARVRRAAAERLVQVWDANDIQGRLVQAQASRKRGHLPLRQLFSAAPDVMTALKPCWAMSPLVVSQLLPGDRPYFDVVIFDEASQVVPADAIGAISRARQVVVAGDQHQLPPTAFFAGTGHETESDEAIHDDGSVNLALTSGYESVLDVLTAGLGESRKRSLTWHYRSRDERLIAFSNAWIYDSSLTTFPGVTGAECLSHVLVPQQPNIGGQEGSVTNEVERVVDLALEHASGHPHESLGVITMGIKHAERIDARLRERLRERPDLHSYFDESSAESYFTKNLERVQGDERDAIILSVGYGKTPEGRLLYRFGPLLQEGGHRRLNVAITRARRRMTVVSSFSHHDMDPERSTANGVKVLRAYLQYAASGGQSLGEVAMEKPSLNPFEISVRDRLTAAGIPLVAQYGVAGYWIDFAAAHPTQPGRMVLAIEADGATYHSSATARDRDRLRQEQLERLGWSFHRIWSTDWFTDPEMCIERVRTAYDAAVDVADADGDATSAPTRSAPTLEDAVDIAARRGPRPGIRRGLPITAYSQTELAALIRWLESDTLLRTEDEIFEEFMGELGFKRRGARIRAAFNDALSTARRGH